MGTNNEFAKLEEFVKIQEEKGNRFISNIGVRLMNLGYKDDFINNRDINDIERIIIDLKPTSARSITTICWAIKQYAKLVGDETYCEIVEEIDRNDLWKVAKPNTPTKYISHNKFLEVLYDIERCQEINSLYYSTLFQLIYEGVFSYSMDVIANLRKSDIGDDDITTFRKDNGYTYRMLLPHRLCLELKELSEINTIEFKNKFGIYERKAISRFDDSCFKISYAKDIDVYGKNTYISCVNRKIKYISKEYVEYDINSRNLYISGIMHRVCEELGKKGISIEETFTHNGNAGTRILQKELSRCDANISTGAFRELVKSYLDIWI